MKKYLNLFNILNVVLILAVLVGDVFYLKTGELWVKSITSAGFVAIGAVNLIYAIKHKTTHLKFCITMLVGLTFAMLGDIFLNIYFIAGAALFAVGHVFYFIAYCFIQKFKWTDLIPAAALFVPAVLFMTLAPIFNYRGVHFEILCIVYALIISCMMGKAVSNFIRERNVLNLIIMVGSILFVISDLMLLMHVFADIHRIFNILCLATYYPAECFLAYSLKETVAKADKTEQEEKQEPENIQAVE